MYLPPQYFQQAYRNYRFPAIELLHGFPGTPLDWITVVGVTTTLQDLISSGLAKPAVLVMPDANGGRAISLQCLNQFHGPQDATYLAEDLPAYIARSLRVQPPGLAWGIAGYSEGGFCAANLGLKYGKQFGFAGVLSGYFAPLDNQLGHKAVDPFGGNAQLRRANTPDDLVDSLPGGTRIAQFWLGAGSADRSDLKNADVLPAAAADPAARGDAEDRAGRRAHHDHLAGADAADAGVDDAAARPRDHRRAGPAGSRGPEGGPAAKRKQAAQPPASSPPAYRDHPPVSPGRGRARAARTAGAGPRAAPGAGRPPDRARPSSGSRGGTGRRRTSSPWPGPCADRARSWW